MLGDRFLLACHLHGVALRRAGDFHTILRYPPTTVVCARDALQARLPRGRGGARPASIWGPETSSSSRFHLPARTATMLRHIIHDLPIEIHRTILRRVPLRLQRKRSTRPVAGSGIPPPPRSDAGRGREVMLRRTRPTGPLLSIYDYLLGGAASRTTAPRSSLITSSENFWT